MGKEPRQRAARTSSGRVLGDPALRREHPRSEVELVAAPYVHVNPVAEALGYERLDPIQIGPSTLECGAVLQLRNHEREADGHFLGSVRPGHDVILRERDGRGEGLPRDGLAERESLWCLQLTPDPLPALLNRDRNHTRLLLERHGDRLVDLAKLARGGQGECGPDIGMPCERKLGGRGEDADSTRMTRLRREHERGLGEVELPGDLLHELIREPGSLGENGHGIAPEADLREDVTDVVAVTHRPSIPGGAHRLSR